MRSNEEHRNQVAFFKWLNFAHPWMRKVAFAVPNGSERNKIVAAKLKAEGVTSGVVDIVILVPNSQYHGLLIEMKSARGKLTKNQKQFIENVIAHGYATYVCYSLDDAIEAVQEYLKLN